MDCGSIRQGAFADPFIFDSQMVTNGWQIIVFSPVVRQDSGSEGLPRRGQWMHQLVWYCDYEMNFLIPRNDSVGDPWCQETKIREIPTPWEF